MVWGHFRCRGESNPRRPYEIEVVENLEIIPRVGEEISLQCDANDYHSFPFVDFFLVEKVSYRIRSSQEEDGSIKAYEQHVLIDLLPLTKSGWSTVQKIVKEFGSSKKSANE